MGFDVLPDEVVVRVLLFLDARELARAAEVCRRWRASSRDNRLWKRLCLRTFPQWSCGRSPSSWMLEYVAYHWRLVGMRNVWNEIHEAQLELINQEDESPERSPKRARTDDGSP